MAQIIVFPTAQREPVALRLVPPLPWWSVLAARYHRRTIIGVLVVAACALAGSLHAEWTAEVREPWSTFVAVVDDAPPRTTFNGGIGGTYWTTPGPPTP